MTLSRVNLMNVAEWVNVTKELVEEAKLVLVPERGGREHGDEVYVPAKGKEFQNFKGFDLIKIVMKFLDKKFNGSTETVKVRLVGAVHSVHPH